MDSFDHGLDVVNVSDAIEGYKRFRVGMGGMATPQAVNRIAAIIRADNKRGRDDGEGRFRSSNIGYCERKQLLSYLGEEQNLTDTRAMDNGTWAHYRWQLAGLSEGFLSAAEKKVRKRIGGIVYGGSVDGVMADGSLFEFKGVKDYAFDSRCKEPGWEHIQQMTIYMGLLGMDRGHLVYESMMNQNRTEWLIPYSQDVFDMIVERTQRIRSDWVFGGVRPPMHPLCTDNHWMRKGCSFRHSCLKALVEEDGEDW